MHVGTTETKLAVGDKIEKIRQKAIDRGIAIGKKIKIGKRKAVITDVSPYLFTCDYGRYKESFSFIDVMLDKRIRMEM